MSLPDPVRDRLRDLLWEKCDEISWINLPSPEKSRYYDTWSRSTEIGGELAQFLDPRAVRVYIKDTLLKDYTRSRLSNPSPVLEHLGIPADRAVSEKYQKPYGLRFEDGGVITWSRGAEWKTTLISARVRADLSRSGRPEGVVLVGPASRISDTVKGCEMVKRIASDLGIESFKWVGI